METKSLTSIPAPGTTVLPAANGSDSRDLTAFAWEKVRRLALEHLDRIIRLEPKVLRGHRPRAVHDFRVASRRFQQAFDLLAPFLPPPEARRLRRRVRRCRRALSRVRDGDVFIQRVEKRLARKQGSRRETWNAILDYVHDRHRRACEKALRKLSRINLAEAYVHLRRFLDPSPEDELPFSTSSTVEEDFHQRLAGELGRVWSQLEAQSGQVMDSPDAANIHRVRIAVKKVRYLVEMMQEFEVPNSEEALTWLKEVQRLLGYWHDSEIAEQLMVETVARSEFIREHLDLASGILKLVAQNRKAKERLWNQFSGMALASERSQRVTAWVENIISGGNLPKTHIDGSCEVSST